MSQRTNGINPWTIAKIVGLIVCLIIGFSMASNVGETVGAGEIAVMQDPIDGDLHVRTQPGFYYQNFGKVTHYKRSDNYWFNKSEGIDQSITIRFNDGGHAQLSGSLRYELPSDPEHIKKLHLIYGSQDAIEKSLLRTIIGKAIYMTGPLLSSKESYAERRGDLIGFIDDQIVSGVYKTYQKEEKMVDPLSGHEKTVTVVKLVPDAKAHGGLARQEASIIEEFGIRVSNISITMIDYSPEVEKQIQQQQQAIMQVQTAIAHAKQAEQAGITAAKEGEAESIKAKWAQEVRKATAVTAAEQEAAVSALNAKREKDIAELQAQKDKNVAKLNMEAAEYTRREQMLIGQGEAARAAAKAGANNSLELRLDSWEKVNIAYAEALGKQAQVPTVMVGSGNSNMNPMQGLIQMLMAKTATDLGVQVNGK